MVAHRRTNTSPRWTNAHFHLAAGLARRVRANALALSLEPPVPQRDAPPQKTRSDTDGRDFGNVLQRAFNSRGRRANRPARVMLFAFHGGLDLGSHLRGPHR